MLEKITNTEWIIVAVVAGLIGVLGAASYLNNHVLRIKHGSHLVARQEQKIEISVDGAVENPGTIYMKPGCTLKEVLRLARLAKHADRKKINLEKIIYKSSRIYIPSKMQISKRARTKKNLRVTAGN